MSEEKKDVEENKEESLNPNDEKKEEEKNKIVEENNDEKEEEKPTIEEQLEQLKGALREERIKRKQAYELLNNLKSKEQENTEEDLDYGQYDQEELTRIDKTLKKLGYVKAKEIEQKTITQTNKQIYDNFMTQHEDLFGVDGNSTPTQDVNWTKFKSYLGEYFDLNNTQDFLNAKKLDKKLNKALEDLVGKAKANELIEKGKNIAQIEKANADKLIVGDGGSPTPSKKNNWKYNISLKEALGHLLRAGYSEKEAKEMLEI